MQQHNTKKHSSLFVFYYNQSEMTCCQLTIVLWQIVNPPIWGIVLIFPIFAFYEQFTCVYTK